MYILVVSCPSSLITLKQCQQQCRWPTPPKTLPRRCGCNRRTTTQRGNDLTRGTGPLASEYDLRSYTCFKSVFGGGYVRVNEYWGVGADVWGVRGQEIATLKERDQIRLRPLLSPMRVPCMLSQCIRSILSGGHQDVREGSRPLQGLFHGELLYVAKRL